MIEYFKSIYLLVKLKNKIFKNTILRAENWYKIVAVVLFAFLFFNIIQSSAFVAQYVKTYPDKDTVLFHSLFSLTLLIIVISNILTTFFLSDSNFSQNLFKTLLHYPLRFARIISYEIISGMGDFINLLFLPFYAAAIFIPDRLFGWYDIITFLTTLILFLLSLSGVIYLLKNLFALISSSKHSRKLMSLLPILSGIILIVIIHTLSLLLKDANYLVLAEKYLALFPTGFYSNFILNPDSSFTGYNFVSTISYFLILNIIIYALNYCIVKFLKNKSYGRSIQKTSLNRSSLTRFFIRIPVSPFVKKDIAYTLRSLRTMFLHLMISVFLPVLIFLYIKNSIGKEQSFKNVTNLFSFSILFNSLIVLSFAGNFFAFERNAIINYFFRPISFGNILKNKTFISNYYVVIILFTNIILLLIFRTEFSIIIFYELLILLNYFLLILLALPLSIYFPKEIDFNAMSGFLTSLVSLFIFFILAFILWFIFQTTLAYYFHSNNKFLIFLILCLMIIPFLYYKEQIFSRLGRLLSKRKEKIIMVFR
ncbi:MAG: hypothetical protein ACYC49_01030 [Ignavibacteriaceae bacterium]